MRSKLLSALLILLSPTLAYGQPRGERVTYDEVLARLYNVPVVLMSDQMITHGNVNGCPYTDVPLRARAWKYLRIFDRPCGYGTRAYYHNGTLGRIASVSATEALSVVNEAYGF